MMRRKGFTLAEVLITLTIVGIVAALTLPTIINKIEEQKIKGLVKKTVAVLVQANKMAKANYDYEENDFVLCVNPETETLAERKSLCSLINTYVPSATYIQKTDPNHPSNYGASWLRSNADRVIAYSFPSGVIVNFYDFQDDVLYFDINGKKGPNKLTHATKSGKISVTGYGNWFDDFSQDAYLGKPERFYDIYSYPLRGYGGIKGDITVVSQYGATVWMLTH